MQPFLVRVLLIDSNIPLRPLTVFTFESYILMFWFFRLISGSPPPPGERGYEIAILLSNRRRRFPVLVHSWKKGESHSL